MDAFGSFSDGFPALKDLGDPSYYMMQSWMPDRQIVVLLSRVPGKLSVAEKIRWIDNQFTPLSSPYPIRHIEFKANGDAIVTFISRKAMEKSLSRAPFRWNDMDVHTKPCLESDIGDLFWVLVTGDVHDFPREVKQALLSCGEVRGEYPPHPADGYTPGPDMLKLYYIPRGPKLPPFLNVVRADRCGRLNFFTPEPALAPRCHHFGKAHNALGCPACFQRFQNRRAGG